MAGLLYDLNETTVYDLNDDEIIETGSFNSHFYNPVLEDKGKRIVRFQRKDLLFLSSVNNNLSVPLVLKQISKNIPRCKFVTTTQLQNYTLNSNNNLFKKILPKKGPIHCTECNVLLTGSIARHFLLKNKPADEKFLCKTCKYIAPSNCSFQAHLRLHSDEGPFVCPDCGKCFENSCSLKNHVTHVCFHLVKRVKFNCPVPRCRRLFVVDHSFKKHFFTHFLPVLYCTVCDLYFNFGERGDHIKQHHNRTKYLQKRYECVMCEEKMAIVKCWEHIEHHMPKRDLYLYVYVCKSCQSTFRSISTYGIHVRKCNKRDLTFDINDESQQGSDGLIYPRKLCFSVCFKCNTKSALSFTLAMQCIRCAKCSEKLGILPVKEIAKRPKALIQCLLCREHILQDNIISHTKKCKFSTPLVKISVYDRCKVDNVRKMLSDDQEESPKKKRKSNMNATLSSNTETETPVLFDGIYRCKFCDYAHTCRREFHNHIISHRNVATSYQCMECGDCFVVKLSLERHLMYFHKIVNVDNYFKENECFDKMASVKEELKENQCSVCMQEFSNEPELNNHFRIHGMAFLQCSIK